jgi:glycosyltransferase involved in cell wall biosynthesis
LIIEDGSKDNSVSIINSYTDSRIRLVQNEQNMGLAASLHKGVTLAQGEYILRIDSDDIALPNRMESQVKFMDENPDIGVAGCYHVVFGAARMGMIKNPVKHDDLCCYNLFKQGFCHPTIIFRKKSLIDKNINYEPTCKFGEDFVIFTECEEKGLKFHIIPEV